MRNIDITTRHGPARIQVTGHSDIQINAFLSPNGGAGFFLVFPRDKEQAAIDAATALLDGEPLEDNLDITAQVPGALVAGTVPALKVGKVEFGTPSVAHSE